jgi:hypothetical protein
MTPSYVFAGGATQYLGRLNPPSLNHRRRDHHGRHRHHQGYDLWRQVRAWLPIATRFSGPVS